MKTLFLDTNILIDIVANRQPFAKWALLILNDQKAGKWKLVSSSNAMLTTYYIIEKQIGEKKAKRALSILLSRVDIGSISKQNLLTSIASKFKDYEDAVQHECALSLGNVSHIITRNKKDFKHSVMSVLSSEELYAI